MFDIIDSERKSLDFSLLYKNNNILDSNTSFENEQEIKLLFSHGKSIIIDDNFNNKISDIIGTKKIENPSIKNKQKIKNAKIKNKEIKIKGNKKRGRNPKESGKHNKFSDDNIRKKVKHILINELQEFINKKISEIYNNDIGQGLFKKKLLPMNQQQIVDSSSSLFNKEFLNKSLKDIFSENISSRNRILPLNLNKQIIEKLLNEKDEEKKLYFRKLFNLTFTESLRHFTGAQIINKLIGLNEIDSIQEKYGYNGDYFHTLKYYFLNYEIIINSKEIRKDNKNFKSDM